eukprot:gene6083-biopygen8442
MRCCMSRSATCNWCIRTRTSLSASSSTATRWIYRARGGCGCTEQGEGEEGGGGGDIPTTPVQGDYRLRNLEQNFLTVATATV